MDLTRISFMFLGRRKETIGVSGIADLQRAEEWRIGENVCKMLPTLGRSGWKVTTIGVLFEPAFLFVVGCSASVLETRTALAISLSMTEVGYPR